MVKMLDRLISLRLGGAAFPLGKGFRPAGIATPPIIPSNGEASVSTGTDEPKDARGWQKRAAVGGRVIPAAFAALALASCATTAEPEIRTVTVKVPLRIACVPADLPPPPTSYADENSSHMTPEDRYLAIARANQERRARLTRLEPVVDLCR